MHWKIKLPLYSPNEGGAAGEQKPGEEKPGEQKPGEQKPGEQKPDDKKGAEGQPKPGEQKPGEQKPEPKPGDKKAPAKYELQVPDDAKRYVSAKHLETIEKIARENDWTQDEAQAELGARLEVALADRDALLTGWETASKADPDYGGSKLAETEQLTKRAIDAIRPEGHPRRESFLTFLKESGGSVNIEVVSALADLGRLMAEDNPTLGRSSNLRGNKPKDDADVLYDHPTSRKMRETETSQ